LSDVRRGKNFINSKPRRFGDSSDWKKISAGGRHFVGLKADGTLWEWGTTLIASNKSVLPRAISKPLQVGNDADWIAICDSQPVSLAVKPDGSVWRWRRVPALTTNNNWTTKYTGQPERWISFPDKKPVTLNFDGNTLAAVAEDGSLWLGGNLPYGLVDEASRGRAWHEMVRLGNNLNWQEAKWIEFGKLVAISRHGLWKWDSRQMWWRGAPAEVFITPQTLQSRYFNWIAISPAGNAFFALAGDGKLCLWGNPNDNDDYSGYWPDPRNLLMPTRIKARTIANVLGELRNQNIPRSPAFSN